MIEMKTVETKKNGVLDITAHVREVIAKSGIQNGIVTVEVPHSTAGVVATSFIDAAVQVDLMDEIKRLVPSRITFKHEEAPDDAAGHIKCALFGNSVTGILQNGALVSEKALGYFLTEYDGPRKRTFYVSVLGDK